MSNIDESQALNLLRRGYRVRIRGYRRRIGGIECVSGGKKCLFFEKFGVLCFLETLLLRFVILPYYRRLFVTFDVNVVVGLNL